MSILNELGLRRSPRNHRARGTTTRRTGGTGLTGTKHRHGGGLFGLSSRRKDRSAGYKAALTNPNTTHAGRQHAKHELHMRGESAHVPLSKKIERTLGIHQTSRRNRVTANRRNRARY